MIIPFTRLDLKVPPEFELVLGYTGELPFVAFFWEPAGDELRYCDGIITADGDFHGWLTFIRHPITLIPLAPYHFGNSDEPARHWLLLDRKDRVFYVGTAEEVARFLHDQPEAQAFRARIPPANTPQFDDFLEGILEGFREEVTEHEAEPLTEVWRRIDESAERVMKMREWLDNEVLRCPNCNSLYAAGEGGDCPHCGTNLWFHHKS